MELEICSFELAKMLKEVGFDEPCSHRYTQKYAKSKYLESIHGQVKPYEVTDENNDVVGFYKRKNSKGQPHLISAPTLELAKMWFREVHGIDVAIIPLKCDTYIWKIFNHRSNKERKLKVKGYSHESFSRYNQALSAGLKEACKIIKTD